MPLMKEFNMFLKGNITYWRDPEGRIHLIGEYGDHFCIVYFSEKEKKTLPKAEYGKISRDFAKEVLILLGKDDCDHLESVLEGTKVSINDLWKASEILVESSKDLQEMERHLLMFGNLLFEGKSDEDWYASVWTSLNESGGNKKVVLYSDSNGEFAFFNLDDEKTSVRGTKRALNGTPIKVESVESSTRVYMN